MVQVRPNLFVASVADLVASPVPHRVVFVGLPYIIEHEGKKAIKKPYPPFATHHTVVMIDDDAWRPHGSDEDTAIELDRLATQIAGWMQKEPVVIVDQLGVTLAPLLAGLVLVGAGLSGQQAFDRLAEVVGRRVLANPCMKTWLVSRSCRDSFCEKCSQVEEQLRRESY